MKANKPSLGFNSEEILEKALMTKPGANYLVIFDIFFEGRFYYDENKNLFRRIIGLTYEEEPESFEDKLLDFISEGKVNIIIRSCGQVEKYRKVIHHSNGLKIEKYLPKFGQHIKRNDQSIRQLGM
jgi:hypothetical protein